ncbi:hypothetical protein O3G_MSEX001506 [Manduca sexta]|uniref:Carboxylic ester hydrolase n=1 Tax=Manduca sexta TaxID=7130 RepID=A0A922CC63_MANSE|nr:hypothetical protein O3G_MSEX001506 [Manduca sexta]KAG6440828.1 hypothetical protein O3G_MSEX001506 [Manduca sexta]
MSLRSCVYVFLLCLVQSNAVQVKIREGRLQGSVRQTQALNKTYYSFQGIPYAKPPVGNLRFMPPQPADRWTGVRNATEHVSVCPQFDILSQVYIPGSEDCLFINVYTPNPTTRTPYSVLFFIHGGGYKSFSGDTSRFGPDFLIEKDVVVVTINYRLDSLGFLCLDDTVSGNMGLKDQVLALQWVKRNIKYFGGNPKSVTIMGESAGAAAVGLHLISPMSKGLFQRAVSMSGVPTNDYNINYKPQMRAKKLAKMLGMVSENTTEILEFLQSIDFEKLINVDALILGSETIARGNILLSYQFLPVVETGCRGESFLSVDPLEAYKNGDVHDVDIMFGYTELETVLAAPSLENFIIGQLDGYPELLVPKRILLNSAMDMVMDISNRIKEHYFANETISVSNMKRVLKYTSDAYFIVDIVRLFSYLPDSKKYRKFAYQFSSYSNRNYYGKSGAAYNVFKAGHMDDLMYLFQPYAYNMTVDVSSIEYALINMTTTLFTNFIKYGNPTPDSSFNIKWPEYRRKDKLYVNIANDTLIIGSNPAGESVDFYESIYQLAGIDF